MAKFRVHWQEEVIQYWYIDVEAKDEEEAENVYHNGEHVCGDEVLDDTDFIDSDFNYVEQLKEEDFNQLNMFED
jgi:hypothetical protein